jgi:hypothetical protein
MQACNRMSYECVPLYDSLGEHAIEYVVRHSEMVAVFVQGPKMGKLAQALAALQVRRAGAGRVRGTRRSWGFRGVNVQLERGACVRSKASASACHRRGSDHPRRCPRPRSLHTRRPVARPA